MAKEENNARPNYGDNVLPSLPINVGCLQDIPNSTIVTGAKGEKIILGGYNKIDCEVGPANCFKSTLMNYIAGAALNVVCADYPELTSLTTYDTEVNGVLDRLENLLSIFPYIPEHPITENGIWIYRTKASDDGDKWAASTLDFLEQRIKDKKVVPYTAFKDQYNKAEVYKAKVPIFFQIDSWSEFESGDTFNKLMHMGENNTNTIFATQGLFKTKLFQLLPALTTRANAKFQLTAQIGENIDMATGPAAYIKPTKKLQYLNSGDVIKGVSNKFNYLPSIVYFMSPSKVLKNASTGEQEYPDSAYGAFVQDLNIISITPLRNKAGNSGIGTQLIVSQIEGILPALSEFHFIKEHDRFGLNGTLQHYVLDLYPECKLSRTTIRDKINKDWKLRRCLQITADLLQLQMYKPTYVSITPADLYKKIMELGYDWDVLLRTRSYWCIDQYKGNKPPFLSTLDLVEMVENNKKPYFLDENKKPLKEYKEVMDNIEAHMRKN